jgi:tetratricopeptide (TPR) repeat protein
MRRALLIALLTLRCSAYELTGRIEPPGARPVFLHGATAPFETSTVSSADGRFEFRKLSAGTYTLAVSTAARGEVMQTIELSPGTVNSKGRLDILLRIDDGRLESDGVRIPGATVSATVLSIPDRAIREYDEAQRCLSRRDSDCASGHLSVAVGIAPQFVAAWNQLGTIAYQMRRYSDAETNFRRALDADPEAFEPLVNLGGVLLNLGRPLEAIGYNRRAVARRPNNALANSQLGLSYFDLNDLDPAEKYLKIAVGLDPAHFSYPQLTLAEIYRRRGDRPSALRQLHGFLDHHPDSPQAAGVRQEIAELSGSAQ